VKKHEGAASIELERTPDVLAALGARKNGAFLTGFAAETESLEANAREKLRSKNLDAIAVNDVSAGAGFGSGENEIVLLWGESGRRELGRGSKRELARRMWDALLELRNARG
jgi:phosphopantothenoylcysteine decarboxylase/phosphopantothenate--cysteine ligase